MRRTKKVLVSLLVFTFVLWTASAAFAGFSDTAGTKYEGPASRLASLDVLTGYPDGSFKPGANITRAEFAAVVVRALGLESAAQVAKGATKFSDVPGTHWASGYINVASDQGIINGYPDGSFKPEANVTYAEALAMVLRALGYEPTLRGAWPTKYLIKAAELGISKGVTFSANTPATRGDVAVFVDNSLMVAKVVQVGFGDQIRYVVSGTDPSVPKTTLLNNLGATYVEGMLVDSPELFANDGKKIKVGTTELELVEGTPYAGLLGHTVKAWKNADGKVFLIEDKTPADRVKVAKLDSGKLKVGDTELTVPDAVYAKYFKNRAATSTKPTAATPDNNEVNVVLDADGKTVVAAVWTESTQCVVDKVTNTSATQVITAVSGTTPPGDLKDKTVIWTGDAKSLAEVQKDDVLAWYADAASWSDVKKVAIHVTRKAITGKLTEYVGTSGTVQAGKELVIGGTAYKAARDLSVSGLLGKDVKAALDRFGKVMKVADAAAAPAKTVAMVVYASDKNYLGADNVLYSRATFTLLKGDGTRAETRVAKKLTVNGSVYDPAPNAEALMTTYGLASKSVVEYTLNAAGEIDTITKQSVVSGNDWLSKKETSHIEQKADATKWALIASDTAVFDASATNTDDWKVISTATLLADTSANGYTADVWLKDNVAKAVVVQSTLTSTVAEDRYGLVVRNFEGVDAQGNVVRYLRINVKGTVVDYVYDAPSIAVDTVVKFKPNADNTIGSGNLTVLSPTKDNKSISALGAGYLTLDGASYRITANTQVFNLNKTLPGSLASTADLVVGLTVDVYTDGTTEAKVITFNE